MPSDSGVRFQSATNLLIPSVFIGRAFFLSDVGYMNVDSNLTVVIAPGHLCFWSVRSMLPENMASYTHWSATFISYTAYCNRM